MARRDPHPAPAMYPARLLPMCPVYTHPKRKAKWGGYEFVNEENENELDTMRAFVVVFIAACVFLILVGAQNVFAHGGGLNEQGCHQERETGECHCYRDEQGEKISPPVISPDRCDKSKPKPDIPSEPHFVAIFCLARDGRVEDPLPHRMRADCITKEHAIEGDFAPKWVEAYSQSLRYAREAHKKAGILLILKNEKDEVYIRKLCDRIVEQDEPIDVFAIGHGFAEEGESVSCLDER